ncbi:unnamed protein product [Sphagnum jensenii]|uniref:Lipoprotein n=1 Tax=Sphagnum jensenii TaxID=128206 RepID=A0ABP0VC93_9BRYO
MLSGCSSERKKNEAKEAAARYWQDKAYPGKAYDVQVLEAEKSDDGKYRVKGIVDGETRVGEFNPDTETFSEGFYASAHEKQKRIAELEEEVKYWKDRSENLDKQIYKLKVRLNIATGKKVDDFDNAPDSGASDNDADSDKAPAAKPAPKAAPQNNSDQSPKSE